MKIVKTILSLLSISIWIFMLIIGCEKKDRNIPIEMEFFLLDEGGVVSNTFKRGENFRFLFVIRNNSPSHISFNPDFVGEDFFHVFSADAPEHLVSIGKPYQNVFCLFSGSEFIVFPKNEYRFEIPWIPPGDNCCRPFCISNENDPLPKGKYRTAIEGPFNFVYEDEPISITEKFLIDFEIE